MPQKTYENDRQKKHESKHRNYINHFIQENLLIIN